MSLGPVGFTCPNIDRIIKNIKNIEYEIKGYEKNEDLDSLKSLIGNIDGYINGMENELEDIRTSNSELRKWGRENEEKICELEEELEELKKYKLRKE